MKTTFIILITTVLATSAIALNPSRTYKQRPDKYNMDYDEVKVKTNDGSAELNVWVFPNKSLQSAEWVLLLHSGEGNMADYLRRIDLFRANYNVVIFDYRGYGASSEFEIDHNMYLYPHFQDDVQTMFDYCHKQHSPTFNLYGWGIGGGLALGMGYHSPEVKRIVADTPFLSMEDLEERFADWDDPMEVPFAGFDKKNEPLFALDNAPGKNLKKVKLIIGSNDMLYTLKDMKRLQAKSKVIDKNIYMVENPDRKDNFKVNKAAYFKAINDFLKM